MEQDRKGKARVPAGVKAVAAREKGKDEAGDKAVVVGRDKVKVEVAAAVAVAARDKPAQMTSDYLLLGQATVVARARKPKKKE